MGKKYLIIIPVLILANSSLILGMKTKPGWDFLGRRGESYQEIYPEISMIEQARQGKFSLINLYSDKKPEINLISPLFVLAGRTAAIFHLSTAQAYQLFRILISILLVVGAYRIIGITGGVIAMTSSLILEGQAEYLWLQLLILWIVFFLIKKKWIPVAVGMILILCEVSWGITSGYWIRQMMPPDPLNLILGLGLMLPAALPGIENTLRNPNKYSKIILIWPAVIIILIFIPGLYFAGEEKLLLLPVGILAAQGVSAITKKWWAILLMGVILAVPLAKSQFDELKLQNKDTDSDYMYHMLKAETAGMVWLRENTTEKDKIFSNWFFGNIIPGIAGRRVYAGHKLLTDNYDDKLAYIQDIAEYDDAEEEKKFFKDNGITYIYTGEEDEIVGGAFVPDERDFLQKVYDKDNVRIYKVK